MDHHLLSLFSGVQYIWFGISIYLILLLILSHTRIFRKTLNMERFTMREYITYTVLFTAFGIFGTFWNFQTAGGVMTFRAVSIILSGYLGGPVIGTLTGLNVGIIRACLLHTANAGVSGTLSILLGIAAGQISLLIKRNSDQLVDWVLIDTLALELVYWFLYALLTWPMVLETPINFFGLAIPVMFTNIPPVIFFIWVLHMTSKREEKQQARMTNTTFNSVNLLLDKIYPANKSFDPSSLPQVALHGAPELIWAAVIAGDTLYSATSYKTDSQKSQGDTELSILYLQHSMPSMKHIKHIQVEYKGKAVMDLYAAVSNTTTVSTAASEYLEGIKKIIELLYDREMLKNEELLLQEAEIKALQAQINPHFLYNTLNTIAFYTRTDPETARKLISYLSEYFRYTLNNPNKLIPLKRELYDIQCYMELQKARFGENHLFVDNRIPGDIAEKLKIPPLLLQPLVENAVIHGLRDKEDGGTIVLGFHEHKTFYRIYVKDDGVGIYHYKLKSILSPNRKRTANNIGLTNVQQRLKSIFGPGGKLQILSRKGQGTIAYIDIPKEIPAAVSAEHVPAAEKNQGRESRSFAGGVSG